MVCIYLSFNLNKIYLYTVYKYFRIQCKKDKEISIISIFILFNQSKNLCYIMYTHLDLDLCI